MGFTRGKEKDYQDITTRLPTNNPKLIVELFIQLKNPNFVLSTPVKSCDCEKGGFIYGTPQDIVGAIQSGISVIFITDSCWEAPALAPEQFLNYE